MEGGRELFTCPACSKRFAFWVQRTNPHPKVKCSYCHHEFFPKGEPPAAPTPAAAPPTPAASEEKVSVN